MFLVESVKSDSNLSDSRSTQPSKPQTHLLATCQRNIMVQNQKEYKLSTNPSSPLPTQRSKKSISPSPSEERTFSISSSPAMTNSSLKSQLSFQKRDSSNHLIPNNIEATIMCSLITTLPSLFMTPTSSQPSSPSNTSKSINKSNIRTESKVRFEVVNSSIFYVTVDGTYDTKLRCDTQISLYELLQILHEVNNSKIEDLQEESMTISWSEIESLSHQIIHQILLNFNEVTNEYSVILPEENLSNIQFRNFLGQDKDLLGYGLDGEDGDGNTEHSKGMNLTSHEAIHILQSEFYDIFI